MINLRYHVVSLIAVFLALGMGIVMGSTVIDRVTVDALNNRLEDVRRSVNGIREENRALADQVRFGRDFADQSADLLVRDRLAGVPVVIVAVSGIDRKPVESLRSLILASGADLAGTVWVQARMRLGTEAEVRGLATALDLPPVDPDTMRRLALARLLADSPAGDAGEGTVTRLVEAGFVSFEPAPAGSSSSSTSTISSTTTTTVTPSSPAPDAGGAGPGPGARYVVVSGAGAEVGDDILAVPLAQALAATSGRGVAAEAGEDTPGGRGVFVGLIRDDPDVATRLSTVDNLESSMGQVATVIAIEGLPESRFGHFGVGPGSQSLLPADE